MSHLAAEMWGHNCGPKLRTSCKRFSSEVVGDGVYRRAEENGGWEESRSVVFSLNDLGMNWHCIMEIREGKNLTRMLHYFTFDFLGKYLSFSCMSSSLWEIVVLWLAMLTIQRLQVSVCLTDWMTVSVCVCKATTWRSFCKDASDTFSKFHCSKYTGDSCF